ncbi:MAG: ankyrin repeat domain-containing protein [Gemmatimonadetes bacterium]|nr:ankyrin repeat domain-containing protein [Gemmatimonadota bacterium]
MRGSLRMNVVGPLGMLALLSVVSVVPDSPVADAAMRGDVEAVRLLLRDGADVNAAQGDGMTALHWTAQRGDVEIGKMLIYAGANVSAVTRMGHYTPIHLAAKAGSAAVIEMLVEAGAAVRTPTASGATALHFAASTGDAQAVAALVDHGADVDVRESESGQTPLIFAAANNRPDAIRILLERGADPDLTTKVVDLAVEAALGQAASKRQDEILAAFGVKLAEGRRGERQPGAGQELTPSQARAAALAAREVYLSGKAEPARSDDSRGEVLITSFGGLTALLHAARQGYRDATIALLNGGADVDRVSASDGTSPLLMAAINGQFDTMLLLIQRGADPNLASTLNGSAPLWATINSYWQPKGGARRPKQHDLQKTTYLEVLEALLKAGANPDARMTKNPWYFERQLEDTNGSTAFWRAAYATDVEAMRLLSAYGADPNIPTRKPPFTYATKITVAGVFMEGEENWKDPTGLPRIPVGGPGSYAIHAAAGIGYGLGLGGNMHVHAPEGWLPSLRFLVEELGLDVNQRDHYGYTALHHAASRGDNELILYLVSRGADVTMLARTGQTVADMANGPVERVPPFPATINLLEALGSRNNHWCVNC